MYVEGRRNSGDWRRSTVASSVDCPAMTSPGSRGTRAWLTWSGPASTYFLAPAEAAAPATDRYFTPNLDVTRLNAFARSCLFNATAVATQCHTSKLILSHSPGVTTKCAMCSFSPQKINRGPSPHLGTAMQTPFSPLSFGKSFMKIRSAVPENGCLVFLWRTEKAKKKHL